MDDVIETFDAGIYTITLNRPDKKNAMDTSLLQGLYNALKRADEQAPQIIIIRGSERLSVRVEISLSSMKALTLEAALMTWPTAFTNRSCSYEIPGQL